MSQRRDRGGGGGGAGRRGGGDESYVSASCIPRPFIAPLPPPPFLVLSSLVIAYGKKGDPDISSGDLYGGNTTSRSGLKHLSVPPSNSGCHSAWCSGEAHLCASYAVVSPGRSAVRPQCTSIVALAAEVGAKQAPSS
mmetsp:Transcript_7565/g.19250  ORF Transcript_7565/g.19250 Transcript_7565/m.19250 type:complete len:137 (+) Transcript_7565:724-1134(+)